MQTYPFPPMKHQIALSLLVLGSAAPGSLAQSVTNPSFEADLYTVWPGYVRPNGGVLTGWTPGGSGNTVDPLVRTGVNSNPPTWNPPATSPFGNNGVYPDGTQVGFLQAVSAAGNSATTTLSNTVTGLTPGESYRMTFRFTSRAGQFPNGSATVGTSNVNFRSNAVEAGNSFTQPFRTGALVFTATGTSAPISLGNFAPGTAATDTTLVIDDIRVVNGRSGWTTNGWSDDATSGISSGLVYTHAFNLGTPLGTTINGVDFVGVDGGSPAIAGSFSTTGWTTPIGGDDSNVLTASAGGSAELARRFVYGGAAQSAQTLTLEGLTPGVPNHLTLFGVGWSDAAAIARAVTANDGTGDILTMDQHVFGLDQGVRFDLDYVPAGNAQTFTFTPTATTTTMHLYGFANGMVPEPSTAVMLGITAFCAGLARRRC